MTSVGPVTAERTGIQLRPNNARVLFRPFEPPSRERAMKILARVLALGEREVEDQLGAVLSEFHGRHQRLQQFFLDRFEAMQPQLLTDRPLAPARRLLIGAYFTQEYALESAALFNPSIVWHPDQTGVPEGSRRFILSLRAVGEGHISSVGFRSGIVNADGRIGIDPPTGFVTAPAAVANAQYDKELFLRKLLELGVVDHMVGGVFGELEDRFTLGELTAAVGRSARLHRGRRGEWEPYERAIMALARANYEIECDPASDISERVIFPYSPAETNGIEDARFVRFTDDDGTVTYCATFTAFDGAVVLPQFVETADFVRFRVSTLNGPEIVGKGMALFPRRIRGSYAMLSRQDGENLFYMESDMLHFWHAKQLVMKPTEPWEYVQIGNCGSPLETEAGWLVLTHGVGPMRKYAIGAALLDLDEPTRVIGRLAHPLLSPMENERAGYVPNVVYSCGAVIHAGRLVIPYSMSDYVTAFATVRLDELLEALGAGR